MVGSRGRQADRDGGRRNGTVTSRNGELLHNLPYDVPHNGTTSITTATRPHRVAGTSRQELPVRFHAPTVAKICSIPPMLVSGVSGRPSDPMSTHSSRQLGKTSVWFSCNHNEVCVSAINLEWTTNIKNAAYLQLYCNDERSITGCLRRRWVYGCAGGQDKKEKGTAVLLDT